MERLIKISDEQTIFDIAIQFYGDIEGVIWLLEDNPSLTIETMVKEIIIREDFIRKDIVDYLISKGIYISTAIQNTPVAQEETHNEFTFEFNFEFN